MSRLLFGLIVALSFTGRWAFAHHSFAAYFAPSEPLGFVALEGTVNEFRYTNPHGLLVLSVVNARGEEERWTIETLAPAMLSRIGWSRDSFKPGERIKVEGWRARDGTKLLRLQNATREDGSMLGQRAPPRGAQQ